MPIHNQILPPRSLAQIVSWISELDDASFSALVGVLDRPEGFDLDENTLGEFSRQSGLSEEKVGILLSALSFLYDRIEKTNVDLRVDSREIRALLVDLALADQESAESLTKRLPLVLARRESHAIYKKLRRLEAGFLPNAIGFSSFVDIRPVINSERTKVDGYTLVIQLNIETDSTKDLESDYTIQLTPKSLEKLKTTLTDVQRKLDAVRAEQSLADRLWETK